MQTPIIYTIGPRDNEPISDLVKRLKTRGITAVADCRSRTESRRLPQYTQHNFKQTLLVNGIRYAYVGNQVGDHPESKALYDDHGNLKRTSLVRTRLYREGINRLATGTEKNFVVAVFDTDPEDPTAHRNRCIARTLKHRGFDVVSLNEPTAAPAAA